MKHASLLVRSIDTTSRSVDCLASSEAIDSYGEIVDQRSWRLDRYKANPVVLFGHNSKELPIGRAENVHVAGDGLRARIVFANATANPKAEQCFELVKAKMLTGISVGFMPGRVGEETRAGKSVVVLYDNELHELSVVPIPANPEALIRAKATGLVADELSKFSPEFAAEIALIESGRMPEFAAKDPAFRAALIAREVRYRAAGIFDGQIGHGEELAAKIAATPDEPTIALRGAPRDFTRTNAFGEEEPC